MPEYVDVSTLEDISIVDFLARLGHHPVRKTGKEHFYHSMLRDTKKDTPSLTVWDSGGRWLDRGGAGEANIKGGGIVQLGMAYWPRLSFVEVLHKIREVSNLETALIPEYVPPKKYPTEQEEPSFKFELVKTRPLGSNFILTQYLQSRGILDMAEGHLNEIYYRYRDKPEDQRTFYAVGWQNEHQNWEFSNAKGFKSSTGAKGISIVSGNPGHAVLFEGYMDYLSWLKETRPQVLPTAIVLNSIVLLDRAINRIKNLPCVDIYFDNDSPGRRCTGQLLKEVPHAVDRSYEYQGHKDYNDKLMREMELREHAATRPVQETQNYPAGIKR